MAKGRSESEGGDAMADVKAVVRELHDRRLSPRRIRLAAMEDVADAVASHSGQQAPPRRGSEGRGCESGRGTE